MNSLLKGEEVFPSRGGGGEGGSRKRKQHMKTHTGTGEHGQVGEKQDIQMDSSRSRGADGARMVG